MGLILWVNRRRCSALAIQLVYLYTHYWMPLIDYNHWDLIQLQQISNGYKIGPDKRIAEIFLLKKYSPSCPYIFCSSIVISRSNFPYLCQCSNRTRTDHFCWQLIWYVPYRNGNECVSSWCINSYCRDAATVHSVAHIIICYLEAGRFFLVLLRL